jgi:hypothetical protein
MMDEVTAAQESSASVETLLKQREKKMEQGNSSASSGSGALEEVVLFKHLNEPPTQLIF